jgi:hypothetical protein
MTCADCKYASMGEQMGYVGLLCRFNPPTLRPIPRHNDMAFVSLWPMVTRENWCAKHEADRAGVRPDG